MKFKNTKRAICLIMSVLLVSVLSIQVFANTTTPAEYDPTLNYVIRTWKYYRPYTVYDQRMAVSGSIGNDAPVKLLSAANTNSQQFMMREYGSNGTGDFRLFSKLGYQAANRSLSYAINAYRSGNWPCTMLQAGGNRNDSEVDFNSQDASGYEVKIKLVYWTRFLKQNGLNNQLTWSTSSADRTTSWVQE